MGLFMGVTTSTVTGVLCGLINRMAAWDRPLFPLRRGINRQGNAVTIWAKNQFGKLDLVKFSSEHDC